jgi:serine protease AprX
MNKRLKFLGVLMALTFAFKAHAQSPQYAFLVTFTDKNPTTFTLNNPQAYLSTRSLDRRTKYNIAVDSTDLPVVGTYIDSILHLTNGVLHVTTRWQNAAVILIPDSASILTLTPLSFVKNFRLVAYYPTGLHMRPAGDTIGNRPTGFDQNYYGAAWTQIHLCNGEALHNADYRGTNKLIAVIDVGFTGANTVGAFDSLFQENRLLDTHNFILDTSYVFDYDQHGTNVLSCMASLIPETHVGTAPKALYALYVTDDAATEQIIEESNLLAAAERADSLGADVITTSLGYNTFDNPNDSHPYSDMDGNTTVAAKALNAATRKGIFVLASAGNEAENSWHYILTPGDADSVMTVGAVTNTKVIAGFSSYGPNAANVLKPDVCGMGSLDALINPTNNVIYGNGTSFATPVIAGLSACLMEAAPQLKPLEIRALISSYCDSFSSPSAQRGYGVPDFNKALAQVTAIQQVSSKSVAAFMVFPNPAKQYIVLQGDGKMTYTIMDLQGRILKQGQTLAHKNIFTGDLASGIYAVQIQNEKYSQTLKLAIQ